MTGTLAAGPDPRHLRVHRADDARRLVGAGGGLRPAADRAGHPPARTVRPMKYWIGAAAGRHRRLRRRRSPASTSTSSTPATSCCTFVVLATAWNILGGYAGYVNFGTGAFFGLGAYSAVVLFKALERAARGADRSPARRSARRSASASGMHDAAPARHLLRHRHGGDPVHHGDADGELALRRRRHRAAAAAPGGDGALRQLHPDAVRGDGAARGDRGLHRALHPGRWIGRGLRAIRDSRGGGRVLRRADAQAEAVRLRGVGRADGRGRRADADVPVVHRAGVELQPELRESARWRCR